MKDLRIVFMGTPDFAVPSLEILVKNHYQVVAVITAPDKPKGRGQKVTVSPVKECALRYGLRLLQPPNLKDPGFIEELRSYKANLQVVVAFRMLPEVVWNMPEIGTFNLHASLLPQYRGAAPINWAIINGEQTTGVTTFFLKHEIDTGQIIFQEEEPIHPDDTAGSLYQRLMTKGAQLVLKTTTAVASGNYPQVDQQVNDALKKAPKIFRETCEINWHQPKAKVYDFVRGLSPYPGAWTTWGDKTYKILSGEILGAGSSAGPEIEPGQYETDQKNYLYARCADGSLAINKIQAPGKKVMDIKDFLRGNPL